MVKLMSKFGADTLEVKWRMCAFLRYGKEVIGRTRRSGAAPDKEDEEMKEFVFQ